METPPPDWDLLAVVRSCCTTTSTTTSTVDPTVVPTVDLPPQPPPPPLFHLTSPAQDLQDICNPLICSTTTATTTTTCTTSYQPTVSMSVSSPVSSSTSFISTRSFGISTEQPQQQPQRHQQLRRMVKPTHVVFGALHSSTSNSTCASTSQSQRSKKRKNLMKRVCHVPAEGLSNDMWAWRKYGQKPIKGSPYPRGYYRCSSSKGCLARKQVERNRSDPNMFIITYTAEHNHPMPTHRNSLAGSTRLKPTAAAPTSETTTSTTTPENNPTCSSPSGNSLSPLTESKTENDEMKDESNQMGLSELMLEDDFYVRFEQIDGDDGSDGFSDPFSPSMEFPWLVNSSSTATAASWS